MSPKIDEKWIWAIIVINVLLSTTADTVSTVMWERRSWQYLTLMIIISPLVYGTFGYVASFFGLSIAAAIINSLVVVGPVIVGLCFRYEWRVMPWQEYVGMMLVLIGITLIVFYKPK